MPVASSSRAQCAFGCSSATVRSSAGNLERAPKDPAASMSLRQDCSGGIGCTRSSSVRSIKKASRVGRPACLSFVVRCLSGLLPSPTPNAPYRELNKYEANNGEDERRQHMCHFVRNVTRSPRAASMVRGASRACQPGAIAPRRSRVHHPERNECSTPLLANVVGSAGWQRALRMPSGRRHRDRGSGMRNDDAT